MMKRYFGLLVGIILLVGLVSFVGSGSDLIGELRVTTEHPFLVGGEWVVASELNIGDELTTVDGKLARITSIERVVMMLKCLILRMMRGLIIMLLVVGWLCIIVMGFLKSHLKKFWQKWNYNIQGVH